MSPTRVSGCRRRLLLGGTSGLSSSRRGAGGREQSGHTTRAWPFLEGPEGRGAGQGGTPPGTHPVSRGGAVGGRRLPAPRGPPRAPPTAHLPRPASRAWRPRRSVLHSRARFSAPALRSWRLGAMGECDPADVCSRPAGRWPSGWLGGRRAGWGPGLPRGGPCWSRVDAGLCARGWLQLPCPRPCPLAAAPKPPGRKGISLEGAKLTVRDAQQGTEVAPGLGKGMSSFKGSSGRTGLGRASWTLGAPPSHPAALPRIA